MKPLRIGIDARMFSDSFTGIGRYNFELTKRLFEQAELNGRKLEWVIFMNDPEFSQFDFPAHVEKVCVNARHYSVREQWHFYRLLNKFKCDLVHFTHFNLPLLYRGKFTVTIHDTTISFFPGKKMNVWWRKLAYNLVFRKAVKAASKIITVSQNTKNDVMRLYGIADEEIKVIHNGLGVDFVQVSESDQSKVAEKYDLKNDFCLYTGVWREHKNLTGLITAFNKVIQTNDQLSLVITGKPDPFYPEVQDLVSALGLEDKVRFVGLVPFDDLVALYNKATAFVFPSFYEGFGFPPLEAMLTETPVAASNTASIPEVCGKAALYFDPYNPDDMAQKIKMITQDEALRSQLIKAGKKQVKNFSWNDCADSTFAVYETAL